MYIPKVGDVVRVNKVIGDDPKLLRNNQVVESVTDIPVTDIETYLVELVGYDYFFTNHDIEPVE